MTDEVRQEDRDLYRELLMIGPSNRARRACGEPIVEPLKLIARHASPYRDRIAVLEGALNLAAQRFEWLALGGVGRTNGACPNAGAREARATLNGEKKDG